MISISVFVVSGGLTCTSVFMTMMLMPQRFNIPLVVKLSGSHVEEKQQSLPLYSF